MTMRIDRARVIAAVQQLPPLPRLVHELDAALRDEDLPADAIAQLIASDQAMMAAALRLANTSFYGVGGRVVSLRDAVQILGLRTLSSVVMTAAVMSRFDRAACPGFDVDACWRHALASALCAQTLAEARGLDGCAAYSCGLLHDVGTLALATAFPAEFAATRRLGAELDLIPVEAERRMLGIDHAEVGATLATHWCFAPALVQAIRLHHEVPEDPDDPLLDVVHFADNVVHALDLSQSADDTVPPLSLATWDRMGMDGQALQDLFQCIEERMGRPGGIGVA